MATGLKLTRHLVNTIFKIFDVDHDDQLSYKEFIGIMKDRLHRGTRVSGTCIIQLFIYIFTNDNKHIFAINNTKYTFVWVFRHLNIKTQ